MLVCFCSVVLLIWFDCLLCLAVDLVFGLLFVVGVV